MLKKVIITSSVAAVAMFGAAGIAYADSPSCDAHETHTQSNKGHQLVGGNADVSRITGGVLTGQIDKAPGICPSFGNNNDLG